MHLQQFASDSLESGTGGNMGGAVNDEMNDEQNNEIPLETSRGYQLEMYEASMNGNTIVVMDTGSGKTHVAKLRIQSELEKCPSHQLVWFLAPSVPLCEQQHHTLSKALPYVQTRLLIGSDDVDRWKNKSIWDTVLEDVRIVVSTHAVLSDALSFGFVRMDRLALLVFDEATAHHCARNHPANIIMRDYYHPRLQEFGPEAVPSILGLTASPAIRSKLTDVDLLERNLNARCQTPRIHRSELSIHVPRPEFLSLEYISPVIPRLSSLGVELSKIYRKALMWSVSEEPEEPLQEPELNQLKKFVTTTNYIQDELGAWAADYYIRESVEIFRHTATNKTFSFGYERNRNHILLKLLEPLMQSDTPSVITDNIEVSAKVDKLIAFLETQNQPNLYGIIFVERRAAVAVLYQLLSVHPRTKSILRCGSFVGSSSSLSKKSMLGEWLNPALQAKTLDEFRKNTKNIIISTSVLEEGIDVSACNLVICFDKPSGLKAYIQRRGRARKDQSLFVLMTSGCDIEKSLQWEKLEEQMNLAYEKDMEEAKAMKDLEDAIEYSDMRFEVKETRALVTFENVMARIHHFCTTLLNPQPYIDLKPMFKINDDPQTELVGAVIILPNCVDSSVRVTTSKRMWETERMAMRDAAFHAYVALYKKGLLNDHLLPAMSRGEAEMELMGSLETRDAIINVTECFDPWLNIAEEWSASNLQLHQKLVTVDRPGQTELSFSMVLPTVLPHIPSFQLYVDEKMRYRVSFSDLVVSPSSEYANLSTLRQATSTILLSASSSYMKENLDFISLFVPFTDQPKLLQWLEVNTGSVPATEALKRATERPIGIIRDDSHYGAACIFHRMLDDDTIEVIPRSKRRDFLHYGYTKIPEITDESEVQIPKIKAISVHTATAENMSLESFLALDLHNSILRGVGFNDIDYIITATNSPSANEATNYQRQEFIGDSVLKYLASVNLFVTKPTWPEGFLSRKKDKIVSNARLSRAAVESGLDRYIFTKVFTARKWCPAYISDYSTDGEASKRMMSTKTLADVVEALIGGAFMEDGVDKALRCARSFLPDELADETPAQLLDSGIPILDEIVAPNAYTSEIETLIGYEFKYRSLLIEAMIHPSFECGKTTMSYQRLEFLGDAVLDMVIINYLTQHARHLPHQQMHLVKTAMVNTGYLAYLCMDTSMDMPGKVEVLQSHGNKYETVASTRKVRLCQYMKHNIAPILEASLDRYNALQPQIQEEISHGTEYPWTELSSLVPEKFMADMIESIMGAIIIDTCGDLTACNRVAEKLGILKYLQRIIDEEVDLLHPKNVLGELVSAQGKNVRYDVVKNAETGYVTCTVFIDEVEAMEVTDARSDDEATTKAASLTLERIRTANPVEEMDLSDDMNSETDDRVKLGPTD
ncbi:hypothetical protein B7463_g6698, partial [Scytalidium lignicola]